MGGGQPGANSGGLAGQVEKVLRGAGPGSLATVTSSDAGQMEGVQGAVQQGASGQGD